MKRFILALVAIPAAVTAVEASAQTGAYGRGAYTTGSYGQADANLAVRNQIAGLHAQLDAGLRAGTIDRREGQRLSREIRQLENLRTRYARGGFDTREWSVIQQRVGSVSQQVQIAGGAYAYRQNGYGNGYGYGNGGYAYDQYGRPVANNGYNNGYYGQGGPYEPYAAQRSNGGVGNVVGGVLGSVLGGGGGAAGILGSILGNGGLRVGDLISGVLGGALGGVPRGYETRYRDRNDVYFRSDGQRVYEIDARTNTVVAVHPLR